MVYFEIQSRWELAKTYSALGSQQGERKHLKSMLAVGEELVARFPFSPIAHETVISPLIFLEQKEKALEHAAWLLENDQIMSNSVMANLLVLGLSEDAFAGRAQELFVAFRRQLGEEDFSPALASMKQRLLEQYPELGDGQLDQVDGWGA